MTSWRVCCTAGAACGVIRTSDDRGEGLFCRGLTVFSKPVALATFFARVLLTVCLAKLELVAAFAKVALASRSDRVVGATVSLDFTVFITVGSGALAGFASAWDGEADVWAVTFTALPGGAADALGTGGDVFTAWILVGCAAAAGAIGVTLAGVIFDRTSFVLAGAFANAACAGDALAEAILGFFLSVAVVGAGVMLVDFLSLALVAGDGATAAVLGTPVLEDFGPFRCAATAAGSALLVIFARMCPSM